MRFLVDASLSPIGVRLLLEAGHDAVHVGEVLRLDAADHIIFERAAQDGRLIVAADTDFGELLAVEDDLLAGAIVVIEEHRVRVRALPIVGPKDTGHS